MKYIKSIFTMLLTTLLIVVYSTGFAAEKAKEAKLTIIHIADVYKMNAKKGRGGLPKFAAFVKAERAKGGNVIVTHAGDALSPSLMSTIDGGAHMVKLLSMSGLDIFALGNHEFDRGSANLNKVMKRATFEVLSSDINDPNGALPNLKLAKFTIKQVGPFKVGFIAVMVKDVVELTTIDNGISFSDPISTAVKMANLLRKQGVNFVVLLAHTTRDTDMELFDLNAFDVILAGHDHELMLYYDNRTVLLNPEEEANYIWALDITMKTVKRWGRERLVWSPTFRLIDSINLKPDPVVLAKTKEYQVYLDANLSQPIGTTTTAFDSIRNNVRTKESASGNLIADAMREGTGAQIAITNGGGIRGKATYESGDQLSRKTIFTELPFGNLTYVLEIKGSDLLAALENGVSQVEKKAGRFPHVSGLNFVYDPNKPKGQRIVKVSVDGNPLDLNKVYTLATNDYMAKGGDGYKVLKRAKVNVGGTAGKPMTTHVIDYITKRKKISPVVEGRIIVVGQ